MTTQELGILLKGGTINMAQFSAVSEADIVGNMVSLPFPPVQGALPGSPNAYFMVFSPGTDYYIFNTNAPFAPTASVASFSHLTSAVPFVAGAGQVDQIWKADTDAYLWGTAGSASTDTLLGLLATAKLGDATKTNGTEQQVNQFFFKFDDKIHGSSGNDKLCGWAGQDSMWGNDGDDEFYYGKGMGKDKILDLNKSHDQAIFDTDLVENFRELRKDAKLKSGQIDIKFDSSDKLTIVGIDTLKELKKVVAFDDFTDFA
jgi:hypothetical protein